MFDHETLAVYQLQLQFIAWVATLVDELKGAAASKTRVVRAHLDEASLSTLLNMGEW